MTFNFEEDFQKFENNPEFQKAIERILNSNDPFLTCEWINDKMLQKQGIDLKIHKGLSVLNIDLKGVSYAKNHRYLEDISVELVSNYDRFIKTKGKKGKSWLFKDNSKTERLLYYWLDERENVKPIIFLIDYLGLRKWALSYFNVYELYPFLNDKRTKDLIVNQKYKTIFLGKLKDFRIFSSKNESYFTINFKIRLTYLNKLFHVFDLGLISKIMENPQNNNSNMSPNLKLKNLME